jgi:hypothetical protein
LSGFERGKIVDVRLAGACVTKSATLLGVLRVTGPKVTSAYINHRKITSAKRNSGRNSTVAERDIRILKRIVLKNQRTTAAQVNCSRTEYSK